jgi:hypothetical protein
VTVSQLIGNKGVQEGRSSPARPSPRRRSCRMKCQKPLTCSDLLRPFGSLSFGYKMQRKETQAETTQSQRGRAAPASREPCRCASCVRACVRASVCACDHEQGLLDVPFIYSGHPADLGFPTTSKLPPERRGKASLLRAKAHAAIVLPPSLRPRQSPSISPSSL